jgi:hypothetical protein
VREKFKHTEFAKQTRILSDSLYIMAVAAESGPDGVEWRELDRLAARHSHGDLDVRPTLYDTWLDCLLEAGASRVYAVDVGQGQLDASLRADGRVVVMEKTNARQLPADAFPDAPGLATLDVSFISLEKVLPSVFAVLTADGVAVALVKPQFEIGKGLVGKGGVVRDAAHHRMVVSRVARFCVLRGWHVRGVTASPLKGPKGNREFFLHLTRAGRTAPDLDALIAQAAESAEPA